MVHIKSAQIASANANLLKDEIKVTFTLDMTPDNLAVCKRLSFLAESELSVSLSIGVYGEQMELPYVNDAPAEAPDDDLIPEPTDSEVLDGMIDAEPQPEIDPATIF